MSIRKPDIFPDQVTFDGQRLDANVASRILSAKLIRPYDGATSVEIVLSDPDFLILRSGLLSKNGKPTGRAKGKPQFKEASWARFGRTRLVLDGVFFRLAGVHGGYSPEGRFQLTVTFEDEVAATLRRYKRSFIRTRGNHFSRAAFVFSMCHIAGVLSDIPETGDSQPVQGNTPHERAKNRRKGIDKNADLTIKDVPVDKDQIKHLEEALAQADEDKAGERATIAMLCAGIGESGFREIPNSQGSGYEGVFQADPDKIPRTDTEQQAHYFLIGGKGFQQGGAIELARENPNMGPGEIAYRVEGSISNFASARDAETFYGQWEDEANAILAAWGGAGTVLIDTEEFEFRNPKGTSFWATQGNLAREVGVRHFATENVLNYVSDDYLIRLEPIFQISPDAPGVLGIEFDADVGLPISELTTTARKPRWTGRPGIPVTVADLGPLDGRWLLARIEEDLYDRDPATVVCRRPSPQLKEPAPNRTKTVADPTSNEITTDGGAKGIVEQAANIVINAGGKDVYVGSAWRPNDFLPSGTPSDHSELGLHGDHDPEYRSARDVGVRGIDLLTGPPSPKLDAGAIALGEAFGRDYGDGDETIIDTFNWHGFRIQIIWRTPLYGGHMGHIHIGARKL